jgi:hypothetical protein
MVMVSACGDALSDLGFQRFLFQRSFLNELNSHTIFGILPDDVIELIFANLGIKIDYKLSSLMYELKYCIRPKLKWCRDSPFHLCRNIKYNTDDKKTIYKMVDDSMKVHFIAPYSDFSCDFKCIIIENFDYSLLQVVSRISAQRFMEFYQYILNDVETTKDYHTDIHSPFFIFKKIIEALYTERLDLGNSDFRMPDEYMWWDDIADQYKEEVEDEHGIQGHTLDIDEYLNDKMKLDDYLGKTGPLIIMDDHMGEGIHLSFNLGFNNFSHRVWVSEKSQFFISKSEDEYNICRFNNVRKYQYPDNVRWAVGDLNKARKNFKKLLTGMKVRRERKVLNILRYAKTGIEPSYNVKMKLHSDLLRSIKDLKWNMTTTEKYHLRRKISESYIYCSNIFMIKEYERLKQLYLKSNDKDEKIFFLMKIGMMLRKNTRSHLYECCYKDICNFYESPDEGATKLEMYDSFNFLGCDKDEEIYINPERNPHTYTRPAVSLDNNMYRASKDIDYKYDIVSINRYYAKMKIFKKVIL